MDFKLILVDPKEHLVEEWKKLFSIYPNVSFHHGKFEEVGKFDCIINAGNSFGLMDGGVDEAISDHYGPGLQYRVQTYIKLNYHGEQPVGTSFLMPVDFHHSTSSKKPFPYLAHTPTMRAPTIIRDTDNVYNAFRAALLVITQHNDLFLNTTKLNTVVCMGLGTRTGGMSVEEAARQMHLAYKHMMDPADISWPIAKRKQLAVSTNHKGGCLDYMAP